MFYFYSTQQTPENSSFHKGLLFEDLLRSFLRASGFDVDVKRRKETSLEYDIHGKHSVDHRHIIGEAKAHTNAIAAHDFTSFVGKTAHLLMGTPRYSGLFLSTSSLSPETEDYIRNALPQTGFQVTAHCGADLEGRIRETLRFPSVSDVSILLSGHVPHISAQHLLHTDRGTFIATVGSGEPSAFDDRFALVSHKSEIVRDPHLLTLIQRSIQSFQSLTAITPSASDDTSISGASARSNGSTPQVIRTIPFGLVTATEWLDYRRPAGENFFVGRRGALTLAIDRIEQANRSVVLEIKARSGVGKSSLLAVLAERLKKSGQIVELHDARDVQSANDVLQLIQRFAGQGVTLSRQEMIGPALEELLRGARDKRAVFLVDQFESTFASPEVYFAYEYLALCIAKSPPGLTMVYARKDDLLTTHDEMTVDLHRLRSLSESIALDDFAPDEAIALLNSVAKSNAKKLSDKVLEQVLEFAQGFPWLLKRTMAHVANMINRGVKQQELLTGGLHLGDLFEEEIAGLDEHERGYLTRIAAVLPSTYQSLVRRFEDDPFLREMLEKLTSRRILRFSAGIYDTYNDVFKDFILYERLPERSQSSLFRVGLVPVTRAFRALGGQTRVDPEKFSKSLGKSIGSTYNILRELRISGLVVANQQGWVVSDVARQYEHQGRLGEFIRQSVLRNRVVSDFMIRLERDQSVPRAMVPTILSSQFPFIKATDTVWVQYTNLLLDWIVRLQLARVTEDDLIELVQGDKEVIFSTLGNLHLSGKGARAPDAAFMPSVAWTTTLRVLDRATRGVQLGKLTKLESTAVHELRRLGAVRVSQSGDVSAQRTKAEFEAQVKALFSSDPYTQFWNMLRSGTPWAESVSDAFSVKSLAHSTKTDLGKKLANWGKNLGFLEKKRLSFLSKSRRGRRVPESAT